MLYALQFNFQLCSLTCDATISQVSLQLVCRNFPDAMIPSCTGLHYSRSHLKLKILNYKSVSHFIIYFFFFYLKKNLKEKYAPEDIASSINPSINSNKIIRKERSNRRAHDLTRLAWKSVVMSVDDFLMFYSKWNPHNAALSDWIVTRCTGRAERDECRRMCVFRVWRWNVSVPQAEWPCVFRWRRDGTLHVVKAKATQAIRVRVPIP